MSQNTELKERNVPIIIKPQFNCDCSEIIFFLPGSIVVEYYQKLILKIIFSLIMEK